MYAQEAVQDYLPLWRRRATGLVLAIVAGILAGAAIMLQIRGWSALNAESGGACGGNGAISYGACPRGNTGVLIGSFIIGFLSVPTAIGLALRGPWLRRAILAVALACGVLAGQVVYGWLHGTDLSVAWAAPYDTSSDLTTVGAWTDGDSLIRVRVDELVSYQAATGHQQWVLPVPGQYVACALSLGTAGGVGLVGYGTAGGSCDNVMAVDAGTGRKLWSAQVDGDLSGGGDDPAGLLAVTGSTGVVVTSGEADGIDLRTGTVRWVRPAPAQCPDQQVAAGGPTIAVLSACDTSYDVTDIDAATGKQAWRAPVTEAGSNYEFQILSADPVTVSDELTGPRGVNRVRVFSSGGRVTSAITVSGIPAAGGTVNLDTAPYGGFGPAEVVTGNTLVGITQTNGPAQYVVAYRLSDGQRLWMTRLPDSDVTLRLDGDQVLVVDESRPSPSLEAIGLASGQLRAVGFIPRQDWDSGDASVFAVGQRAIVVNDSGVSPTPPVAAISGLVP